MVLRMVDLKLFAHNEDFNSADIYTTDYHTNTTLYNTARWVKDFHKAERVWDILKFRHIETRQITKMCWPV